MQPSPDVWSLATLTLIIPPSDEKTAVNQFPLWFWSVEAPRTQIPLKPIFQFRHKVAKLARL